MKIGMRAAAAAVTVLLLGALPMAAAAAQEPKASETMRVLVPLMNDSGFVTYENGSFSGYYVDYLTEIAKYTGWTYELVPVETREELDRACEAGDFDLMTGIIYSREYDDAFFDYPRHTVGAKRYVFAVPRNTQLLADGEYSYLRGVKIGISDNESGRELEERFRDFCFLYGIECVSDREEDFPSGVNFIHIDPSIWREKLETGGMDGLLCSDTFCLSQEMYAITTFGLDRIYFVAPNGSDRTIARLNDALKKIKGFDPEYNNRLYEKYFVGNMQHIASFGLEERDYLKEEHVYTVAVPTDLAPYSYKNEKEEASGMIVKALSLVTEQTKGALRFAYRFYDSVEAAATATEEGECDISGVSMYSLLLKRDTAVRSSMSFYSDRFMYYKNDGVSPVRGKRTVILPELPQALLVRMKEENTDEWRDRQIQRSSAAECLREVENGKSSFTVMLSHTGDYYKSYYGYQSLSSWPVSGGDVMFCLAYAPTVEQTAVTVIDKCLAGVEMEELQSYVTELTLFEHEEPTIGSYIREHSEFFALLLAAVLLTVCTLLVLVIISITRNSRRIHALLYRDDVTGGLSYKAFMEEAEKVCKGKGKKLILYVHVNSFKYINNVFGYEQGDDVLREIKIFLEGCMRGMLFARVYADRFVALISYTDEKEVRRLIGQSLDDFEEQSRKKYSDFNIWVKVGAYILKEGDRLEKAVNLANYAVDAMPKTPSNDYIFYDDAMYRQVLLQKEVEKDMRSALENGEFEAFYQPKYHIDTKELMGAEALVRWRHPTRGLLFPGAFIPVFEKNHFIIPVDFYIFESVCCFIRKRLDEGRHIFPISSNFSRLHLSDPDFAEHLTRIAGKYRVPPRYLEIEITETVAMEDFNELVITVKRLKERGFQVSIDDFGSGYSSIQLLYKLPIDVLKFDKAFVDHVDVSRLEEELVDSIITVSKRNGIRIICEGVETTEQEDYVRKHNCVYVQGFLYSRPVPEEDFRRLMEQ